MPKVCERAVARTGVPAARQCLCVRGSRRAHQTTAQALLDGIAPGCGSPYRSKPDATVDGLFHPSLPAPCRLDVAGAAQTAILARVAGDHNSVDVGFQGAGRCAAGRHGLLQAGLVRGVQQAGRLQARQPAHGAVADTEWQGHRDARRARHRVDGGGDVPAPVRRGMDANQVAWTPERGADAADVSLAYGGARPDGTRAPYLARREGSALLMRAAAAVTGGHSSGLGSADTAVRDAKFIAYVGHDTNIANVAGILDLTWTQAGYQRNQTPPAGALVFEVAAGSGQEAARVSSYVAQSLEQMRKVSPLTLEAPPSGPRRCGCAAAAPTRRLSLPPGRVRGGRTQRADRDCVEWTAVTQRERPE